MRFMCSTTGNGLIPRAGKFHLVKWFHCPCSSSLAIFSQPQAQVLLSAMSALPLILSLARGGLLYHIVHSFSISHYMYTSVRKMRVQPPCQSHPVQLRCLLHDDGVSGSSFCCNVGLVIPVPCIQISLWFPPWHSVSCIAQTALSAAELSKEQCLAVGVGPGVQATSSRWREQVSVITSLC